MKFENLTPKDIVFDIDLKRDWFPLYLIVLLIIIGIFGANIYHPEFSQYGYAEVMSGTVNVDNTD